MNVLHGVRSKQVVYKVIILNTVVSWGMAGPSDMLFCEWHNVRNIEVQVVVCNVQSQ